MHRVPLAAAARALGLPGRIVAMGVVAVVGAFAARVPAPSLRVDLESASYPAVVVAAVVPVVVGAIAAAPPGRQLAWLLNGRGRRGAAVRVVELAAVALAAALWAAVTAAPAGLIAAAAQNALVTLFSAVVLARLVGGGAAVAIVTAAAIATLLTTGATGSAWMPVDGVADPADWVVTACLAAGASVSVWHGPRAVWPVSPRTPAR